MTVMQIVNVNQNLSIFHQVIQLGTTWFKIVRYSQEELTKLHKNCGMEPVEERIPQMAMQEPQKVPQAKNLEEATIEPHIEETMFKPNEDEKESS